ncbi:hypothetical protein MTR67_013699 [Solanum verrucosum]|uniref:Uncharacterized protein n=1 Tax=Solanum verrucosum TaxID=315347 RepID=A0AAF0QI27_SOLVR|nr:hypothetical protein MTR67_013699 [Solanum verrucosum]
MQSMDKLLDMSASTLRKSDDIINIGVKKVKFLREEQQCRREDTKTFYSNSDQSLRSKESSHTDFGSF